MKRYVDWALKTLVTVVIANALLGRRSPPPVTPGSGPKSPDTAEPLVVDENPPPEMVNGTEGSRVGFVAAPTRQDLPSPSNGFLAPIKGIVLALSQRLKEHNLTLIAASLAYFALLALFPTAIASVSIYGLVADPARLEDQIIRITDAIEGASGEFIADELNSIVTTSPTGLGVATVIAIVAALWSASAGVKALIKAINIAYDTRDDRSYAVKRGIAMLVTLGIIIVGIGSAVAVAFLPRMMGWFGLADETVTVINVVRWPAVFLIVVLGLGALYKLAPNRPARSSPWLNYGAGLAALVWVLATVGLAVYVNHFSSFPSTYGALAGVIVVMLWFFVSGLVILLGAELNSELEQRHAYARRQAQQPAHG